MKQVHLTFLIDEALRIRFLEALERDQRSSDDIITELLETYIRVNVDRAVPVSKGEISAAERARRENAVRFSRASLGLEGVKPSAQEEEHARQFVNGEIDLDEYVQFEAVPLAGREQE